MIDPLIIEALNKGLKSTTDIVLYVSQNFRFVTDREPQLVQDEFYPLESFSEAVTNLADKLSRLPMGDYGILSFKDRNDKTHWKGLISDGSNNKLQPELYGLYQSKPHPYMLVRDMVSHEVRKRLPEVARANQTRINIEIVKAHDLHAGSVLKNVSVPGFKQFSSVLIESITTEGVIKLLGGYRGSSKKRAVTVPASSMQIS